VTLCVFLVWQAPKVEESAVEMQWRLAQPRRILKIAIRQYTQRYDVGFYYFCDRWSQEVNTNFAA